MFLNRIKSINKLPLIIFLLLIYLLILFFTFRPNMPTHIGRWNDNYQYRSVASNFINDSDLETSFYFAESVLRTGFPSVGYRPTFYSFLMGIVLIMFGGNTKMFFALNYILFLGMFLISYYYSRERMDKKNLYLYLLILSLFPAIIIFTNVLMREILFFVLIPLIYYYFFKTKNKFLDINHLLFLILLAITSIAKESYLILALFLLGYIYYFWLKKKYYLKTIISIIIFLIIFISLIFLFYKNPSYYPGNPDGSVLRYFRNYGFTSLFTIEFLNNFKDIIRNNFNSLLNILKEPFSFVGSFHYLFLFLLALNVIFLKTTKNKNERKEIALILIPEILTILLALLLYIVDFIKHLRPVLGFIPLNLVYIFTSLKSINFKKKIAIISIFIIVMLSVTFIWVDYFFYDKQIKSFEKIATVIPLAERIKDYKIKESIVIANDLGGQMRDIIFFNKYKDIDISMYHFPIDEKKFSKLSTNKDIDMWIIDKNGYIERRGYLRHLDNSEIFTIIENDPERYIRIYINENEFLDKVFLKFDIDTFEDFWKPLNNCKFEKDDDLLIIDAYGDNPYFENINTFNFNRDSKYFLRIEIISPQPSYLQIYYNNSEDAYNESDSLKYETNKSKTIIAKIPTGTTRLRIDPGTLSGKYIIKDLSIYSSEYSYD